jgi:geranylgeranyl diphosphate synthase type II
MNRIAEYKTLINQLIQDQNFKRQPEKLYTPIDYVMMQGGKRLRPLLTLLACDLFGGNLQLAKYPALAIEVFHNFTLVHDDIMDEAPLRRGFETVYKKWNANIAILSGDTMFAMAYQYAVKTAPDRIPLILDTFSKAAIEVCEGQQLDMDFEQQSTVTIDDYIQMITLKTAVLLGASLQIGAITAYADAADIENIYRFGIDLGIAFQLQDDMLDVYGSQQEFGKKNGGDIIANKKTYIYLKALELANNEQKRTLVELYQSSNANAEQKIKQVTALFDALNVKAHVSELMQKYYDQSFEFLDQTSADHEKKAVLKDFARQLYHRTN